MSRAAKNIDIWWDDRGSRAGWYVEVTDGMNQTIMNSQMVWFPVDASEYNRDEEDELRAAVETALAESALDAEVE